MTCDRCEEHPEDAETIEELIEQSSFGAMRREMEAAGEWVELPDGVLVELLARLREVMRESRE